MFVRGPTLSSSSCSSYGHWRAFSYLNMYKLKIDFVLCLGRLPLLLARNTVYLIFSQEAGRCLFFPQANDWWLVVYLTTNCIHRVKSTYHIMRVHSSDMYYNHVFFLQLWLYLPSFSNITVFLYNLIASGLASCSYAQGICRGGDLAGWPGQTLCKFTAWGWVF